MSVENNIFLRKDQLPSVSDWQKAMTENGFDISIDTSCDTASHDGYWPCKYRGVDSGFEYWVEPVNIDELKSEGLLSDSEAEDLGDRDLLVTLCSHADYREGLVSAVASAALTHICDGRFAEAGEPPFINASESIEWAKKAEQAFLKYIEA